MPGIPPPIDGDDDDVAWALQTAQVQWQRGAHADAIVWLRRAVDAAIQAGAQARASQLNAVAGELTEAMLGGAAAAAPAPPPPPPREASAQDVDALLSGAPAGRASIDIEFEEEMPTGVISDATNPFLDVGGLESAQNPFSEPPAATPWATEPSPPPEPSFPPVRPPPPPRPPAESLTQVMPDMVDPAVDGDDHDTTTITTSLMDEMVDDLGEATQRHDPALEAMSLQEGDASESDVIEPPLPPFDHVDTMTDVGQLSHVVSATEVAPAPQFPPSEPAPPPADVEAPPPPAAPEPPPAEPEPAADAAASLEGVSLGDVPGLEDLPPEAQEAFAASARVVELDLDEEVGQFAVALVLSGWVSIMPAIADAACAHAAVGEVVFTTGSLEDGVALRVVAGESDTRVAVWDAAALEQATADCPWVADELRVVADRYQALAGATMGPLGDRLDDALRAQVTDRCSVRLLLPGEEFVQAGAAVPGMHIVGAGRVEVIGADGAVLEELGPGDFLFAAEVMSAGAAHGTARAGEAGALLLFAERMAAHELLVSVPPLLEILAS